MANHFSALKRDKQTKKRTLVNRIRKTRMRHQIRELRKQLETGETSAAAELLPKTFSIIDRAAKWGVIKKNTAARYKSRLHGRLKKLSVA